MMATVQHHVTSGWGQKILGHLIFAEQKVYHVLYPLVKLLCIVLYCGAAFLSHKNEISSYNMR
jgi:hypothetical protein